MGRRTECKCKARDQSGFQYSCLNHQNLGMLCLRVWLSSSTCAWLRSWTLSFQAEMMGH